MEFRQHNFSLDGSDIPYCVGDRQYAQDKARDFWHLKEYVGMVLESYLEETATNITISGCVGSQGAGHTLSWTAGKIKVPYTTKSPTNWSALPPPMTAHTIPIIVDIPAMTNQAIASATTNGVTTNYAKFEYNESTTSSRTRAKKAGAYDSEVEPSYTFTCDSTPPTASEVSFATFTSDGATLTFTNAEQRFDGDYFKISNNLSEGVAATMRTNLDVPSNAQACLVANNLSDVTPATARTNLDVYAKSEVVPKTGGTFTGGLTVENAFPYFKVYETDGTANKRKTTIYQNNDNFNINAFDDSDIFVKSFLKYDWANEAGIETLAGYRNSSSVESEVLLKEKVIEIGDWNMDTTDAKSVAHNLTFASIVSATAFCRNDTNSVFYNITGTGNSANQEGNVAWNSTTISLIRVIGGFFDSNLFDSTSYNRGWIYIKYLA